MSMIERIKKVQTGEKHADKGKCKRNAKRYMKRLHTLEEELQNFIKDACEYQDNTFHSHPEYYIEYFEIRLEQLGILHNLPSENKKRYAVCPVLYHILMDLEEFLLFKKWFVKGLDEKQLKRYWKIEKYPIIEKKETENHDRQNKNPGRKSA